MKKKRLSKKVFTRRDFIKKSVVATGSFAVGFSAVNFLIPKASLGDEKLSKELFIATWGGSFAEAVRDRRLRSE